jgi:uncharacterized protein YqfB (UPF0267 family)
LKENRSRAIQIKFFVDESEKNLIEKKIQISDMSKSDYLRKMAIDGFIIKQDLSRFDAIAVELSRIDTKIEELIKEKNIDSRELKALINRVENVWVLLRKLMK